MGNSGGNKKNYKITIYNTGTKKVVGNKTTETLPEVFAFARKHIVSTNKKGHLIALREKKIIVIVIHYLDLVFGDDILIGQVEAKLKSKRKRKRKKKTIK